MYTVKYGDTVIVPAMPESALSSFETACGLKEGTDYTISGTVITLTDSGYQKVLPLLGSSGGDGGQEPGTDEPGTDYPGTDVPGDVEGTMYTVKYGDTVIAPDMPESALSHFVQTYGLVEDTDYTIDGAVITLTESGYNKVTSEMPGEGDEPVPDVPVPDVPGDVEGTMYTVMYNGAEITAIPASELSYFETVLTAGTDYTISETVITLTESGFNKLSAAGSGAGE